MNPNPPTKTPLSPWSLHVQRWHRGCGGSVCKMAERVCLARGKVPCDLLFVGEAPGESEDTDGTPFCGPAGMLLDEWIAAVMPSKNSGAEMFVPKYRVAFTNLVGCLPKGEDEWGRTIKVHEPAVEEIELCRPRLLEFIALADGLPHTIVDADAQELADTFGHGRRGTIRLIVAVGRVADEWLPARLHRRIPRITITHPAAVLRANSAVRRLKAQEAVVTLKTALEGLCDG